MITILFLNFNIDGNIGMVTVVIAVIFWSLKVAEFFLIIYASIKTSNGEKYIR
jgi:uncharacterized Tic20 family protein